MSITNEEIDRMFLQYIETALIEFEQPHQKSEGEILDVYRRAFRKVLQGTIKTAEVEDVTRMKFLLKGLCAALDTGDGIASGCKFHTEIRKLTKSFG